MMTSARPMAMSRSRVQTRISLRKECAVLEPEGEAFTGDETGSGLSGIAEVGGSFSSALSIFGCHVFIARALRAALDLIPGETAWGTRRVELVSLDSLGARSVARRMAG